MSNVNHNYFYTDANGQQQGPYNLQGLQELADRGIITPTTLLTTDTGRNGVAERVPGLVFPPSTDGDVTTESDSQSIDTEVKLWIAFGISSFLTLVGLLIWIPLMSMIALPAAIITLILALKTRDRKIEIDLTRRADQGDTQAQYDLAVRCQSRGKHGEAMRCYKQAAESGHAQSQYTLGLLYKKGKGFADENNPVESVRWFAKAAEQGHADAQYELGYCYMMGQGIEEDDVKAFTCFQQAATNGSSLAQVFKSVADVQYKIALAYQTGEEKTKDPVRAIVWLEKAAEQGHADAEYNLGLCYQSGNGIQKDINQAVSWFRKAAEQEHAEAQYELGVCYLRGDGVATNRNIAIDWCKKASANGSRNAEAIVGFKEIEKCTRLKEMKSEAIKACAIELVTWGYKLEYTGIDEVGAQHYHANIRIYAGNGEKVGKMQFGTYGPAHDYAWSLGHGFTTRHIKEGRSVIFNHIIHLDRAGILFESYGAPWSRTPPLEWMKICAPVLAQYFTICYPQWVVEHCPDAVNYVNVVFQQAVK